MKEFGLYFHDQNEIAVWQKEIQKISLRTSNILLAHEMCMLILDSLIQKKQK